MLRAMALEPENKAYMLGFAQLLVSRREYGPARQTLRSLIAANVAPEIRRQAETLLQELDEPNPRSR